MLEERDASRAGEFGKEDDVEDSKRRRGVFVLLGGISERATIGRAILTLQVSRQAGSRRTVRRMRFPTFRIVSKTIRENRMLGASKVARRKATASALA